MTTIYNRSGATRRFISALTAVGISMMQMPIALADSVPVSGPINSTNDGRVVQGGQYYNTPDSKTTFVNSGGGGLWIKSGSNVRGLEVNNAGSLTGNGGFLHFYAPGQVVRVDGGINVNALSRGGTFVGNGGKVLVQAAFFEQNGTITANGLNGGFMQFNVGTALFTPNSVTAARGVDGAGGVINILASGAVDIQGETVVDGENINTVRALVDASGQVIGTFDTAVVNIEGSLVNIDGIVRANGLAVEIADAGAVGSRGGTVRIVASGNTDLDCADCALSTATQGSEEYYNLVAEQDRLFNEFSQTQSDLDAADNEADFTDAFNRLSELQTQRQENDAAIEKSDQPMMTAKEKQIHLDRLEELKNNPRLAKQTDGEFQGDGSIVIGETGVITTRGTDDLASNNSYGDVDGKPPVADPPPVDTFAVARTNEEPHVTAERAGDGGTIILAAANDIYNEGTVASNGGNGADQAGKTGPVAGGNGGTLIAVANDDIFNDGAMVTRGGTGGDATAVGIDGTAGKNGAKGAKGAAGENGADGQNGGKGIDGLNGDAGDAGQNGANGQNGRSGANGNRQNKNGFNGTVGFRGHNGHVGKNGTDGTDGAIGQTGDAGSAAKNGAKGAKGAKGQAGSDGGQGFNGADGGDGGLIAFSYNDEFTNFEGARIVSNGGAAGLGSVGGAGGKGGQGGKGGAGGVGG